ncbi:MAG TPA: porin family protein [Sunxiuqinia sp.]|nr:porin family protein [Sunxiuqinia sp.]
MKKILLLFVPLVVAYMAHAQRFQAGLVGGLNASQVQGDYTQGYHQPGINFGVYVQTDLSRTVYSGMEIKFSQKGSRKNPSQKTGDQEKYIMRLNYMDIPVYLGLRSGENVSVLFGLIPGYLVKGIEKNNYGELPPEDRKPFNDFDLEGMLGVRYQISDRMKLQVNLAYSLVPIRDNPGNVMIYWLDSQFNNVLSTCLYYRFGK